MQPHDPTHVPAELIGRVMRDPEYGPALALGLRMLRAAAKLHACGAVTPDEQALVCALEAEVDQAWGEDVCLHGRAVALYAVRDLAAGAPPRK